MKMRNLALALILGAALTACDQAKNNAADANSAAAPATAPAAAPAPEAAKPSEAEQRAAEAEKRAADAEKRARSAERRADRERSELAAAKAACNDCGTVTAITPVKQKAEGSGAGAVLGAAAGGVAGHQVGGGRGKDVATVIGAIAGGIAGNEIEKNVRSETVYKVSVKMEDGTVRSVTLKDASSLSVGSKVRVVGNDVELR